MDDTHQGAGGPPTVEQVPNLDFDTGMILQAGDWPPLPMEHTGLDETLVNDLAEQLASVLGNVIYTILNLPGWADEARRHLFDLIRRTGDRASVVINGQTHSDAFEAVLSAIVDTSVLAAHANSVQAAKAAAVMFHPNLVEVTAHRINERLEAVGAPRIRRAFLERELRELAGISPQDGDVPDAQAAAARFAAQARQAAGLTDNERALLYYQGDHFAFNGQIWERAEPDTVRARATKLAQQMEGPKVTGKFVADMLVNLQGMSLLDIRDLEIPFHVEQWDPPSATKRPAVVFPNGVLDLQEVLADQHAELRPHSPRWFSEVQLPFDYHPNATCPKWKQFVNQVLPSTGSNDLRRQTLRAFMGYTLWPTCEYEKAMVMLGLGRNGKSVILKVWERMLGQRNVAHVPFDQLFSEFRLAALMGKAANMTTELNHLGKTNEAQFRHLISGERLNINRKNRNPLEATLFAKLIVAANELPAIADTTGATWRRLIVMPFDVQIPETQVNLHLDEELFEELPGIFNWALRGLRDLISNNGFPACGRCAEVLTAYRTDSDSVREFLDECCVEAHGWEPYSQALYEFYAFFCENHRRKPVAGNEFGKRMKRAGNEKARGATQPDGSRPWVYKGLRIKPECDQLVARFAKRDRPGWHNDQFPYAAP